MQAILLSVYLSMSCGILGIGDEKADDSDLLLGLALLSMNQSGGNNFNWSEYLPQGFPIPRVPDNNPITKEKVELGRFLFYEKKLSGNNTKSCGSCHFQNLAFTDGVPHPQGVAHSGNSEGDFHPRNSQPLFNVAYNSRQTWNNILLVTLEQQAEGPLFGDNPVELGLFKREEEVREKILSDPSYRELFSKAFPGEKEPISIRNIIRSIASFQRVLFSGNSAFDKATYQGNRSALSPAARRGFNFFSSEIAECFHCHDGVNFNDSTFHENTSARIEPLYHNNALYNIPGTGNPSNNQGLKEVTGEERHRGGMKAPSLRNVGVTFPYMHDGSINCDPANNPHLPAGQSNGATLEGCARQALGRVLDHYSRGGFNSTCAAYTTPGGTRNPDFPCLSDTPQITVDTTLIRPFPMNAQEKEDLIEFLLSLTDENFLKDPRFSDPF
ncbi:MAG: di-heme enzyme [Leptospira sp.]|nr:di-heme enzyme [Leptospira sp.]